MNWLSGIMGDIPAWINAITMLIAAAAAVTALTPTPKDDKWVAKIRKLVDVVAFNWGGAKNEKK